MPRSRLCAGVTLLLLAIISIVSAVSARRERARGRRVETYSDEESRLRALAGAGASPGVGRAILAGNKINAIKAMRDETGLGLKDAKEAVERMQDALYHYEPWETPPAAR